VKKIKSNKTLSSILVIFLAVLTTFILAPEVRAKKSVEVNARIGAKLVFQAAPPKVNLNVDPVDKPSADGNHDLMVKTNAPSYDITASYGAFEVKGYDLFDNGNLTVASESPNGQGTGGNYVEIEDSVDIVTGEDGYTNNEKTTVKYKLEVDFTVPFIDKATTKVVYTAMMSM